MTSREELIERAAYAAWDKRRKGISGQVVTGPPAEVYDMIRAALAVFEQASTPSDDEREALDQIIRDADGYWPATREAILDTFRRTVSPEPQDEPTDAEDFGRTAMHAAMVAARKAAGR